MAKVLGVLPSNGTMEDCESSQSENKNHRKIWNGLKTTGKIALKVAGKTAKYLIKLVDVCGVANKIADGIELVGDIKDIVDTIAESGNTFNTGMQKSNEAVMGA